MSNALIKKRYVAHIKHHDELYMLQGAFLPYSWEDINLEINFSQMLSVYQLLLQNVLCYIQTAHTDQNYIANVITQNLPALKEKQVST